MITELKEDEIFVFGSNRSGIHGAGAAKQALGFGAKWGVGEGLQGQTYALPTKDRSIQTLALTAIGQHVKNFIEVAEENPDKTFLLTKVGTGLAGYKWKKHIRPLFPKELPENVRVV